jgi:hypothetical protein
MLARLSRNLRGNFHFEPASRPRRGIVVPFRRAAALIREAAQDFSERFRQEAPGQVWGSEVGERCATLREYSALTMPSPSFWGVAPISEQNGGDNV